jgi:hypothetical protein
VANSKLDILPRFTIRNISPVKDDSVVIEGTFTRPDQIAVGDSGWLFATDSDWPLADVMSKEEHAARLRVMSSSITSPLETGTSLPWLSDRWNARDVAFLMDSTKRWRRVEYHATDMVVFGQKFSGEEIFGNQEAVFPLDDDQRFIEVRSNAWDHDHCLICDVAIGRKVTHGYPRSVIRGRSQFGRNLVVRGLFQPLHQDRRFQLSRLVHLCLTTLEFALPPVPSPLLPDPVPCPLPAAAR